MRATPGGQRDESLFSLRCRLGAWLLREHVAATCEHYSEMARLKREYDDRATADRCDYIGIGLRYAVGLGTRWRRLEREDYLDD